MNKQEYFWKQLLQANKEFLFGCSTGVFGRGFGYRKGIVEGHAYSVQRVVEIDGQRLISLRNPWGKVEWRGAWADGSKEWTPEWMQKLNHKFGEDGEFWICYADLLRHYQYFERVRLFGPEWNVSQIWTTLHVPWLQEYNETYFSFTTTQSGPVVIVISQLDDRYFRGLEGQYDFQLSFRVHKAGRQGYIVRSETALRQRRSANVELELEAGEYEVYVKVKGWRDTDKLPVEDTIKRWARARRDKVSRIGKAYDLAHSKGKIIETKEEKKSREAYEKKRMQKKRDKAKKDLVQRNKDAYYQTKKGHARTMARRAKKKEKMKKEKEEKEKRREERRAEKKAAQEKEKEEKAAKEKEDEEKTEAEAKITGDAEKEADVKTNGVDAKEETKAEPKGEAKEESKEESKDEVKQEEKKDSEETLKEQLKRELREEIMAELKAKEEAKGEEADSEEEEDEDDDEDSEEEDDSDNESLASFSDYSDGELEVQVTAMHRNDPNMFDSSSEEEDSDSDNDTFAQDPWNAVAVIGLRVYHKAPAEAKAGEETVTMRVVRPDPYAEDSDEGSAEDGAKSSVEGKAKAPVLDVDDSAIDATLEGELKEKKEVIMGDRKTPA